MTTQERLNPVCELNPHYTPDDPFGQIDEATTNSIYYVRNVINKLYEQAGQRLHDGAWRAHCLHVQQDYVPSSKEYSIAARHGETVNRLKIKARVPELDCALPFPHSTGLFSELSEVVQKQISMHRTYYAYGCMEIPKVGDLILVDFESGNTEYGKYLGISEPTDSTIPDSPELEVASGKITYLFKDPSKAKEIMFLGDQLQPTFEEEEVAYIARLASDAGLLPSVVGALLAK